MIIKTMHILLVISCCLLSLTVSLTVLAQDSTVKEKPVTTAVIETPTNVHGSEQQVVTIQSPTQEGIVDKTSVPQMLVNDSPEVGKHVMANMDAGSMILSLLMVLALIIICALVLKRFNFTQQSASQLKIVTSLSLGAKERVVVIQAGEQQLLLGVTAQQVTLLERLTEPLKVPTMSTAELPKSVLSFLSAKKP